MKISYLIYHYYFENIKMNNLFSKNIKIIYMNNVYKETLGIIEYGPSYNNKFWISFFEILENCNHKFNELNGRLYLISSQGITSIEKDETIPFDASLIVYSEVTALNNAYRYDEKDGYFHTDENNHLFSLIYMHHIVEKKCLFL